MVGGVAAVVAITIITINTFRRHPTILLMTRIGVIPVRREVG